MVDKQLVRLYVIELVGTFALVLVSAGAVCVNHMAQPAGQTVGTNPLTVHQPGLVGVALASALVWAAVASVTGPLTGGWLNPALTMMLWLFNRLPTVRMSWLIGAQFIGGLLAALCLRQILSDELLRSARFGTPHLNPLAYPLFGGLQWSSLGTGVGIELALTFLVAFAIFAGPTDSAAWRGAAALGAVTLVAWPLTGAAGNPARWFGPAVCAALAGAERPFADALVYVAGPLLGALVAGWFCFSIVRPAERPR